MKYYLYKGQMYKSHNKEALVRRLFQPTVNNWGEKKYHGMDKLKAQITRLYGKPTESK